MNYTFLALHLNGLIGMSPLISHSTNNLRLNMQKIYCARMFTPFLRITSQSFGVSLSKSTFAQTENAVSIEHRHVDLHTDVADQSLIVYDCCFRCSVTHTSGGAISVQASSCAVQMNRVTFDKCKTTQSGGALDVNADSESYKFVKFTNCVGTSGGDDIISKSKTFDMNCCCTSSDGGKADTDNTFDVTCVTISISNLNVTNEECKKTNAGGRFMCSSSINIIFSAWLNNRAVDEIITIGEISGASNTVVHMECCNIAANNLPYRESAIISIDGDSISIDQSYFVDSESFYITSNSPTITLDACVFDRPQSLSIETETVKVTLIECQWDDQDFETLPLWIGKDEDYSRLPSGASETYIPTITRSPFVDKEGFEEGTTITYIRSISGTSTQTVAPVPTGEVDEGDGEVEDVVNGAVPVVLILFLAFAGGVAYWWYNHKGDPNIFDFDSASEKESILFGDEEIGTGTMMLGRTYN